jgi:hypothetical protein
MNPLMTLAASLLPWNRPERGLAQRRSIARLCMFLVVGLCVCHGPERATAGIIVAYDINGLGSGTFTSVNPSVTAAGLVATPFADGPGLVPAKNHNFAPFGNSISADHVGNSSLAAALASGDYFTFTITPNPHMSFSLSDIRFADHQQATHQLAALVTSLDNYQTAIAQWTPGGQGNQGANETFSFPNSFQNLTSPLTIRLVGWLANSNQQDWDVLNNSAVSPTPSFVVDGTAGPLDVVSPLAVPEPSSLLLFGAVIPFVIVGVGRRFPFTLRGRSQVTAA